MRWYDRQPTGEELALEAWARLLNDPFITVYTMKLNRHGEWVEDRHYVNPDLAFKRMSLGVANSMMAVRDMMQEELLPAIAGATKAFTSFGEKLKQSLPPSSDGV